MKHISILVPHGHTSIVNIEGTHHILSQVNDFLTDMGKSPVFDVQLVGLTKRTPQSTGLFTVNPNALIDEVQKTNLIIIPAIHGDPRDAIAQNRRFIPWIVEQHRKGAEVASLCIGAYVLAATGLLDGNQCATHWLHAYDFQKMFPEVEVVEDRIMTETNGIYTSGGAYSYLTLLLYLVEKYAGREIAVLISKAFMIDMDRHSQSPFIIFKGQRDHEDDEVKAAQDYLEENFDEKITVDQVATFVALGRRSLERRFRTATGNTVVEYLQRVRVESAKKRLETGSDSIIEVMYDVGYSDAKSFRNVFFKATGLTPQDYRKKYNKDAAISIVG